MKRHVDLARNEQLVAVSILKYKMGYSHAKIAEMFNVSSMTISRLLDSAIEKGIVTISIKIPINTNEELSEKIKKKYKLQDILIVKNNPYEDSMAAVTKAAAFYLDTTVFPGDILGVAAGRTLSRVMQQTELPAIDRNKHQIEIVQVQGGYEKLGERNPAHSIVNFANRFGNHGHLLQHPMYALSKETTIAIYEQYKEKLERIWKKCTVLLCGVGVRGPRCFQREEKLLSEEDLRELDDLEAVGDLYGRWFDLNGNYLACGPNQRVISILPEIQKLIPRRVLISFGKEKITAIDILLKNSMTNILISDELTAKKLIAYVRPAQSSESRV